MWTAPSGLLRGWERIVGPGAGAVENAGSIGLGLAGALLAPRLAAPGGPGGAARVTARRRAVLRVLALDLWGGAWCNNTPAAARWYHREGHGPARRLAFCAGHLHPFVVAWLDGTGHGGTGLDGTGHGGTGHGDRRWRRAAAEHGYLLLAAAVVELVPARRRRAAALLSTAGGVLLDRVLGPSPTAPWFAAVHFTKLLAGHAGGAALLPVAVRGRRDP